MKMNTMADFDVRLKYILETIYAYCTNEEPALHQAVICGDLEAIELFIKCKTDINILDKHGRIPISYVLENSQLEILELLLNAGSNIYELDELGEMQFSTAFRSGHENVIKKYLEHNINLNMTDSKGKTAIHYLIDNWCFDTECISNKLDFHVDVEDLNGQTPLLLAIKNQNLDWVNLLLKTGIYVDYVFERQSILLCLQDMVRYFSRDQNAQYLSLEQPSDNFTFQCMQLLFEKVTEVNKILSGSYTIFKLAYDFENCIAIGALLKKLAIIETSGSSIIEMNRKTIEQNPVTKSYYSIVKAELKRMIELKIDEKVSYFNILIEENVNMLAKNFQNLEFQKDFKKNLDEFSNYRNILKHKYILGTRRADQIFKMDEMLCEIFYLNFPPHVITKIAAYCFSDMYKMPNLT